MDRVSSLVKSFFKKHWSMISAQIKAVNHDSNPKRGFLFDCETPDCEKLVNLVRILKNDGLIAREVIVAVVKEDIFILNYRKLTDPTSFVVVDVSGCLKLPEKVVSDPFEKMFDDIKRQLSSDNEDHLVTLNIKADWCISTVFGYLIGYPILYYLRPDEDNNNLSYVELLVFQVFAKAGILISFSIPRLIHEQNTKARDSIETFLIYYRKSSDYDVKSMFAIHPVVVL